MSETNVQLFPGVFRTTQGGSNPDFFLHSAGRVGIGNNAPGDVVPPGSSSGTFKLNVTGHANVSGTMQANKYYGDGSTLSGVAAVVGGYWDLDQANNNIKYDVGNVGIGGAASSTNELKVHGTVEATELTVTGDVFKSGMALGGNATYDLNGYRIHVFTQSGILYANGINSVDILLVGGGGGGGVDNAGGGGAGGLIFMPNLSIPNGAHNVVVGHGGVGGPVDTTTNPPAEPPASSVSNGGNSTFLHLTALGGGAGGVGNGTVNANNGGSGGGGQAEGTSSSGASGTQTTDTSISADSRTYGHGNNGGSGGSGNGIDNNPTQGGGGGGGGAGAAGGDANSSGNPDYGGVGGIGLYQVTVNSVTYDFASIFGLGYGDRYSASRTYFAGGGAGGNTNNNITDIAGGLGGGGHSLGSDIVANFGAGGYKWRHAWPMNGLDNTGGGGAGSTHLGSHMWGGNGGSGIVILRYSLT